MSQTNTVDQYIEHINSHILRFIDYSRLQKSYETDMVYAKGVLHRLHEAMVDSYGSERLGMDHGDEGFVVIPGIVRGMESGNVCLALLDLDLSSSGEHWGTSFLCEFGVVPQGVGDNERAGKIMGDRIGSYDYCYTATIPNDIHVEEMRLPADLKSILKDFRNHKEVFDHEIADEEAIKFEPMSDWCMAKDYNGAEWFDDGSRPLLAETKFAGIVVSGIPGEKHKVHISVSPYCDYGHFFDCKIPSKEAAIKIATELGDFINTQDENQFGDGRFLSHFKGLISSFKEKSSLRHSLAEGAEKSKDLSAELQVESPGKSEPEI